MRYFIFCDHYIIIHNHNDVFFRNHLNRVSVICDLSMCAHSPTYSYYILALAIPYIHHSIIERSTICEQLFILLLRRSLSIFCDTYTSYTSTYIISISSFILQFTYIYIYTAYIYVAFSYASVYIYYIRYTSLYIPTCL